MADALAREAIVELGVMNAGFAAVSATLFSKLTSNDLIEFGVSLQLLKPGIRRIELLCQLGNALLEGPLPRTRSLDRLECGGAISPDLARDLVSHILQGGADALELRIFVAMILAEIGLARRQLRLLATQCRRWFQNSRPRVGCRSRTGANPGRSRFVFCDIGSGGDQLTI